MSTASWTGSLMLPWQSFHTPCWGGISHSRLSISAHFLLLGFPWGSLYVCVWVCVCMSPMSPVASFSSVDQCFSKFSWHKNHWTLHGLLFQKLRFNRLGGGVRICISDKLLVGADFAGPSSMLWGALPLRTHSTTCVESISFPPWQPLPRPRPPAQQCRLGREPFLSLSKTMLAMYARQWADCYYRNDLNSI